MRVFAQLLLVATCVASPLTASAQPGQLVVHDPFYEAGRFAVRHLQLHGGGNSLVVRHGGRVGASLDVRQRCPGCRGTANQIIVGLAGERKAQACVWSGGARSRGWAETRFTLNLPDVPGVYEVRVRSVQARNCREALGWWRSGRARGPGDEATIGVVVVQGDPDPAPPADRSFRAIMDDLRRTADSLNDVTRKLVDGSAKPMSGRRQHRIYQLSLNAARLAQDLAGLRTELGAAVRAMRHDRRHDDRPAPAPRPPRFVLPSIVVITPPEPAFRDDDGDDDDGDDDDARRPAPIDSGPRPLSRSDYKTLLDRIEDASFPDAQLNALSDAIHAGAFFLNAQAVGVLGRFSFDTHKVDAAVLLCPRIVEPGALPGLLGAMTFESYRDELRKKTHNRCGASR